MEFDAFNEIRNLDIAYWSYADSCSETFVEDLFLPTGILQLGDLKLSGRQEIKEFFLNRLENNLKIKRITRHLVSNNSYKMEDSETIKGKAQLLVFSGIGKELPLSVSLPSTIADVEDIYVKDLDNKWKYQNKVILPVFIGEGAPLFALREK
ncbi:TPA: nuclear transport factor 2 family protein [Acinetobacter baumannii]